MSALLLLLLAAVLLLPSANYHALSGIPLDSLPEYLGLLALSPVIAWPWLRNQWHTMVTTWPTRHVALAITLLCFGVLMKGALFVAGGYEGFAACYRSVHEEPETGLCEKSYANPLLRFNATRVDRQLDIGPDDWNLSFFNDGRFTYYPWVEGTIPRERLPFSANWRGVLVSPVARDAELTYLGEVEIWLGTRRLSFAPSFDAPTTVSFEIPAGRQSLIVAYAFDDGSRVGMPGVPEDPELIATFQVRVRTPTGLTALRAAPVATPWRVAGRSVDALALGSALVLVLVAFYRRVIGRRWPMLAFAGAAAWLVYVQAIEWRIVTLDTLFVFMLLIPTVVALRRSRHPADLVVAYWSVALLVLVNEASA